MVTGDDNSRELRTIGQVVRMLSAEYPDVTHSSLRFLEREGLIAPDRTPGGHRLFTPDQIERIRTIKNWQSQRLSLDEIRCRLASAERLPDLESLAEEMLEFLVQGDRRSAQELLVRTDDAGIPLDEIFDKILRPVLHETGERWARGEFTVGQEKEISAFVRDLIAFLASLHRPDEDSTGPALIAACVEGEQHELGLRMLTALLRGEGYAVYYLGPSVSAEFLIERVKARRPAAVLLTAVTSERLPDIERTLSELHDAIGGADLPAIIIGGRGVPPDWRPDVEVPTLVVTAPDMRRVAATVNDILGKSAPLPQANSSP